MSEVETGLNPSSRKLRLFLISLFSAVVLTWLANESVFATSQTVVLFVLFFSSALWITEAVPAFAVGLMILATMVFTLGYDGLVSNRQEVKVYTDTFSSGTIWLLLGGFFLAQSITNVGLDATVIRYSVKVFGSSPRKMLFGMMAVSMAASMFLSNTTTTAMVIASLMPMIHQLGKTSPISKALVLGIPVAATFGGMGMMIGTPANLVTVELLREAGGSIDFFQWLYYGLPLMLIVTAITAWSLYTVLMKGKEEGSARMVAPEAAEDGPKKSPVVVLLVLGLTVVLWVSSPLHGVGAAMISAIPLVILPMTGVITAKDVRGMGWDTLLLIAGALALGEGLEHSGLLHIYAERIGAMQIPGVLMLALLAYTTMILCNVIGSPATCSILIPLGVALIPQNVVGTAMVIGLTSSLSILLTVSSPANAISIGTGVIRQKDFLIAGKWAALIGPVLIMLWVILLTA